MKQSNVISAISSIERHYKSALGAGMVLLAGAAGNLRPSSFASAILILAGILALNTAAIFLGIADLREINARPQVKHPELWPRFFPIMTIAAAGLAVFFFIFQAYVFFWAVPRMINTVPSL